MSRKEEFEAMKKEYQNITAPEDGKRRVKEAIMKAKMDKKRIQKRKVIRNTAIAAAAALALVILPNTSAEIAYAMENMPVVGRLFKVITIREYTYADEKHQADVKVPQIAEKNEKAGNGKEEVHSKAVENVNKSVEDYTNALIADFEASMQEEGYSALDISHETITDTKDWFTLKVYAVDTQASGYQTQRFYHIDKSVGKNVELQDLFGNEDYIDIISEEIIRQMTEQMENEEAIYFLDDDGGTVEPFTKIKANQNFYFNEDGNMVIVFDEYEVGPGYIGCPEFVMPTELFMGL